MAYPDFVLLPFNKRSQALAQLRERGTQPPRAHWGRYEDDLGSLNALVKGTYDATCHLRDDLRSNLTASRAVQRAKLAQFHTGVARRRQQYDARAEATEMGMWIADYLDDAGYAGYWLEHPDIFKSAIAAALPPMKGLTGRPLELSSLAEYEALMLRQLKVIELVSGRDDKMLRDFMPSGPGLATRNREGSLHGSFVSTIG